MDLALFSFYKECFYETFYNVSNDVFVHLLCSYCFQKMGSVDFPKCSMSCFLSQYETSFISRAQLEKLAGSRQIYVHDGNHPGKRKHGHYVFPSLPKINTCVVCMFYRQINHNNKQNIKNNLTVHLYFQPKDNESLLSVLQDNEFLRHKSYKPICLVIKASAEKSVFGQCKRQQPSFLHQQHHQQV